MTNLHTTMGSRNSLSCNPRSPPAIPTSSTSLPAWRGKSLLCPPSLLPSPMQLLLLLHHAPPTLYWVSSRRFFHSLLIEYFRWAPNGRRLCGSSCPPISRVPTCINPPVHRVPTSGASIFHSRPSRRSATAGSWYFQPCRRNPSPCSAPCSS